VRLHLLMNGQQERAFEGATAAVAAVAYSADNQQVAAAGADKIIRLYNAGNAQSLGTIGAHSASISSLAFAPNNQQLISGSADGAVKLWQLPLKAARPIAHPDQVTAIALVPPDGSRFVTASSDGQARLVVFADGKIERSFAGHQGAVQAVAVSPD